MHDPLFNHNHIDFLNYLDIQARKQKLDENKFEHQKKVDNEKIKLEKEKIKEKNNKENKK